MPKASPTLSEIRSREFIYTIVYDGMRAEFQILKIYDDGGVLRLGRFPSRMSAEYALLSLPVGRIWP
jgi:hypothetical protein